MEIISHRGYWIDPKDKNTLNAFENTTNFGFGTETDIRDFDLELVVSHDISNKDTLRFNSILELFKKNNLLLALNVKADGLQNLLKQSLDKYDISNYFVFDMSIPDTIMYINMGFNVFCRQSEYENKIPFYNEIKGVWLDSFNDTWYSADLVKEHLKQEKKVCIVSADLHKRDHISHWEFLKSWNFIDNNNLILCTDYPKEAIAFFGNKKLIQND
jgi:glycerophosphoryl diester phosphodiesterase